MRLTVIKGGLERDPELDRATRQIQGLAREGAAVRIEIGVLPAISKLGLRLTQIKTMLTRCRVQGFEPNAESLERINLVSATTLEQWEDQRIVEEYALKVVVEEPKKPGRLAVIDIGRLQKKG